MAPDQEDLDLDALEKLLQESGERIYNGRKSWILDCPKCNKKKKLYIRKSDGRFVCWYCKETEGFEGRPEFALVELLSLSLEEIRFKLYGIGQGNNGAFLELELRDFWDEEDGEAPVDDRPMIPTVFPFNFYDLDRPTSRKGVEYLEGRGIPKDIAQLYGVRYDPTERRVVFPIIQEGNLYGWQGRAILPEIKPKIMTSIDAPRDRTLMFHDRLKGSPHAVVTEGPVDGIKCHLIGGNAVTMGKAVSPRQLALLLASGARKLYFALDPDAADETARLVRDIGTDTETYLMEPAKGYKDLGEMEMGAVLEQFHRAQRVSAGHLFIYLN
jgi:DNA primase